MGCSSGCAVGMKINPASTRPQIATIFRIIKMLCTLAPSFTPRQLMTVRTVNPITPTALSEALTGSNSKK